MKLTGKIAGITMYVLLIISVLFSILVIWGPEEADTTPTFLDTTLNWTYVMIAGSVVITLAFELLNIILSPVNAKRSLVSTLGIVVLLALAWFMSDGTPLQIIGYEGSDNVPSMLKISDAGLFTFYALLGVSFLAIVVSEISRIFK